MSLPIALLVVTLASSNATEAGASPLREQRGQRDETSAPPCPAAPSEPSDADGTLLRALLFLAEPAPREIRLLAIENLSLLQDSRALASLAAHVNDPDARIAIAAVQAIGAFDLPRAEELLAELVRSGRVRDPIKLAALERLVFQRRLSARDVIAEAASGRGQSASVQIAAREALKRWGTPPSSDTRRAP